MARRKRQIACWNVASDGFSSNNKVVGSCTYPLLRLLATNKKLLSLGYRQLSRILDENESDHWKRWSVLSVVWRPLPTSFWDYDHAFEMIFLKRSIECTLESTRLEKKKQTKYKTSVKFWIDRTFLTEPGDWYMKWKIMVRNFRHFMFLSLVGYLLSDWTFPHVWESVLSSMLSIRGWHRIVLKGRKSLRTGV